MSVLDFLIAGAKSLKNSTQSMRAKAKAKRPSRPVSYGIKSLNLKSKLALRTWFTRTLAIESRISRIWAPSRVPTSAQKLSSTRARTK